jgi:hypothetical protein
MCVIISEELATKKYLRKVSTQTYLSSERFFEKLLPENQLGAATLSVTTFSIMTLSIMGLNSALTMTLNIMALSKMTLSITIKECDTQHNSNKMQHCAD